MTLPTSEVSAREKRSEFRCNVSSQRLAINATRFRKIYLGSSQKTENRNSTRAWHPYMYVPVGPICTDQPELHQLPRGGCKMQHPQTQNQYIRLRPILYTINRPMRRESDLVSTLKINVALACNSSTYPSSNGGGPSIDNNKNQLKKSKKKYRKRRTPWIHQ